MTRLILICILYLPSVSLFSQWQQTNLVNFRIDCLGAESGNIFASTETSNFYTSLYKSTDYGSTWSIVLGNKHYYSIALCGPNIFAGVAGGVWKSTDYGTTWVQTGLVNFNIYSMALKDTIVFAGTADQGALPVYKSVNNGANWINSGWGCPNGAVTSLYINGDYIYAGYLDFGIYVNNINGGSWSAFNTGLPYTNGYPYIGAIISYGNELFAGTSRGVYRSTDGGPWKAANNGLPITYVNALATTGNAIFAGTDMGAYLSVDTGNTWLPFSEGLPGNMVILSMAVEGTWLFAGGVNYDNGLWRRNIDTLVSIKEMPSALNIYPNPGNGRFVVSNPENYNSYELFDIHGKALIKNQIDKHFTIFELEISSLKPGIYFIRFFGVNTKKTMKIVIQ